MSNAFVYLRLTGVFSSHLHFLFSIYCEPVQLLYRLKNPSPIEGGSRWLSSIVFLYIYGVMRHNLIYTGLVTKSMAHFPRNDCRGDNRVISIVEIDTTSMRGRSKDTVNSIMSHYSFRYEFEISQT